MPLNRKGPEWRETPTDLLRLAAAAPSGQQHQAVGQLVALVSLRHMLRQ